MNVVMLVGEVTDAPKIKSMPSGTSIVSLRVKTVKQWQGKEFAQYHSVSLFGKDAEQVAGQLAPGDVVSVQGELSTRSYEHEGAKKWVTEIKAQTATRLVLGNSQPHGGDFGPPPQGGDDDIPF